MEQDKSPNHNSGLPPPSGRCSSGLVSPVKSESPSSSPLPPLAPNESGQFSHEISQMLDSRPKNIRHRRAHSEIVTLPDDISFDGDLGVVGGGADGPSFSDDMDEDLLSMYFDIEKFSSSSATSESNVGETSSAAGAGSNEKPRIRHQHSQSMDGSTSIKPEMLMSGGSEEPSLADSKKATSAAKLAELALVDPKRAKRIWANRQSAARSKERKMRYIAELERKVQTLQTEATTLSAQLSLLQRDMGGLTSENSELKLRLQTMEQQVHLQDALNDALKEEIQHFKVLTAQLVPNGGGQMMNHHSFGGGHQFYQNNHAMQTHLTAQQFQQLQIHSQKQQHQHHQPHHQHQQAGEFKLRGPFASPGLKDNASDISSFASRD